MFAVEYSIYASLILTGVYFSYLLGNLVSHPRVFTKRHGRIHSILGLLYLIWIVVGIVNLVYSFFQHNTRLRKVKISGFSISLEFDVLFDVVLGLLGTALPLSAAYEFKHYGIKNVASGTLDEHATVTHDEMIEHAFYQGINLLQILFLHCCHWVSTGALPTDTYLHSLGHNRDFNWNQGIRCVLLGGVTAAWLLRDRFPVNKFSDNYLLVDPRSTVLIRTLYRIKKYQYIFYKHFLLHGLNITVALSPQFDLFHGYVFRLYWLLLNTSYVMEFFLQTLVKKKYMKQSTLLVLQHVLMLASSIVAVIVLQHVNMYISASSLLLNFINRKHDFLNTLLVYLVAVILYQ